MSGAIKPVWSAGFKTVTVQETGKHVAADIRVFCGNPDFTKRISRLIAEAGTVHHETGLTPRQLVDRMKAVESAMRDAREMIEADHVDAAYQMLGEAITNLVRREKP